ncbi:hypothetical protein VIGAN_04086400 [Vigna angularis var. angularis]|uniref:Uncharacterized protein n=1 Tax=Vigna angularis var. angularis TaxID=157739 RepID=A0A0S3RST2_PHAAN|nr:hypothetical protein VIGAN_04086400 [Vigna angularis var. angularis]
MSIHIAHTLMKRKYFELKLRHLIGVKRNKALKASCYHLALEDVRFLHQLVRVINGKGIPISEAEKYKYTTFTNL